MSKQDKINAFDADGPAVNESLFGLPFSYEESETIVLPVPWEVTVSYGSGTANGPEAIFEASKQVDLFDPLLADAWTNGIYMISVNEDLKAQSEHYRQLAIQHIDSMPSQKFDQPRLEQINQACERMVDWVKQKCLSVLSEAKSLILIGGDHSTPLGFIQALSEQYSDFAVLQIDAHADLREAYEGFTYSHASIMYNVLELTGISGLVQVGVRDYGLKEAKMITRDDRIHCFLDKDIKQQQFKGKTWFEQCEKIIQCLPDKVYISFDIDGLDPKLCPNTGTPVAGGFEMEEVLFLVEELVRSGREIIGLDINEVAPGDDEWDANVAARLLFRLSNLMSLSRRKTD